MDAKHRLIVALDVAEIADAIELVKQTRDYCTTYKVGLELYVRYGQEGVRRIQALGVDVFLDLKLHDIPNTVHAALTQLAPLKPRFITVHASGGLPMLSAAKAALVKSQGPRPYTQILAVSVLTHLSPKNLRDLGIAGGPNEIVTRFIRPICRDEVFGAVCSSLEASDLRKISAKGFSLVCPGVRPRDSQQNDQTRIATPAIALHNGADFLVIGRPITRAPDPQLAARSIVHEMESALKELDKKNF